MVLESTFEERELSRFLSGLTAVQMQRERTETGKSKIIVLSGPTGVGKTSLSLDLARHMGGEIIAADSMQVYQAMDIGTAKVSPEDRVKVAHHLIDIRNIDQSFSVMEFYKEAMQAIRSVLARGKVPIVVGGTGFYIHALLYGPPQGPPSAPMVRQSLERQLEEVGASVLYAKLQEKDPKYAQTITIRDKHKIIRALEIIEITQKKVSDFPKIKPINPGYRFLCWFLSRPKEELYSHIETRCDEMIAAGLIEEVQHLKMQGLKENKTASQAIGYRQCLDFLEGEKTPEDFDRFVAVFKQASRRYAKKQFTWFRREPLFRWLNVSELSREKIIEIIQKDYELSF